MFEAPKLLSVNPYKCSWIFAILWEQKGTHYSTHHELPFVFPQTHEPTESRLSCHKIFTINPTSQQWVPVALLPSTERNLIMEYNLHVAGFISIQCQVNKKQLRNGNTFSLLHILCIHGNVANFNNLISTDQHEPCILTFWVSHIHASRVEPNYGKVPT